MTRALWLPVVVAAVVHVVLSAAVAPRFEVDSAFYRAQAENLVAVGGSLDANGQPETRYMPGYPLFLAIFLAAGAGYTGAIVAQHVIWVALVASTVWLTWRFSRSTIAALVAGLITALDLPGVQSSISVLSETLAAATLVGSVWCTLASIRAERQSPAIRWALLAGLLAGATVLIRPIAIALGIPLAVALLFGNRHHWRPAAAGALLIAFAVLPAFWIIRNARQTGVAHLSSLAGINLLHFRAAGTLAIRDPGGIDANLPRRREELERQVCVELEARYQRPCAEISWAQRSGPYADHAWPVILGDPIATVLQAARALGMIVFGGSANLLAEVTGMREQTARMIALAYTIPLALLALLGIPYWWKRDRALAALVVMVVLYMFGMALGAEAYSRFRVPVIALYAMLCGGGAAYLQDAVLSERSASRRVADRESKD